MMIICTLTQVRHWKKLWGIAKPFTLLLFLLYAGQATLYAQAKRPITGVVVDSNHKKVSGASIRVKGTSLATVTDDNGAFMIQVPEANHLLTVSKLGYGQLEVDIHNKNSVEIVLSDKTIEIEETVVVGYGRQKKETVVGAIAQTSGKILERAGGVSSVGAALTGNVPG
ncbi:carboxypeptidase-like regulatory domain-containing protein [Sphingobacterium sp. E70]|nr:carboxypeptidase-like regulatory domain-containing protein [Sphingobacterium sp. E70]ULT25168.1 carboxypeptidase-like regulatory domain-containing protein [Sphingobacterium sp. E70]